jgi:tubulin-folding cofactor B
MRHERRKPVFYRPRVSASTSHFLEDLFTMASNVVQNSDWHALRAWVTGADDRVNKDVLLLDITHSNLQQRHLEQRLPLTATLVDLSKMVHQTTGTPACDQQLLVYDNNNNLILDLSNEPDNKTLLACGIQSRMRIHVVDTNPFSLSARGGLEDTRLVKKFELTEEEYDQRTNTLRAWKRQQAEELETQYPQETVSHCTVGARCQVTPGKRRGTVQWIGQLEKTKPGFWVGIVLDEPLGTNDGSLDGKVYFECTDKHGSFVRGCNVEVGDFPERNVWDSDSDEESEI